jgi:hypothetical protein
MDTSQPIVKMGKTTVIERVAHKPADQGVTKGLVSTDYTGVYLRLS